MAEGKITKKETFPKEKFAHCDLQSLEDIENELYQKFALELDGDRFGFRICIADKMHKKDYPINIDCLKNEIYKSEFLNQIVNDIKTYNMWTVSLKEPPREAK